MDPIQCKTTMNMTKTNSNDGNQAVTHQLIDLPVDILYLILLKLDIQSLGRVCQTCRTLKDLAETDFVWTRHSNRHSVVHETHWCLAKRKIKFQHKECSQKEKCRISSNWVKGHFQGFLVQQYNIKQMPWIQLDQSNLWVSSEQNITCYQVISSRNAKQLQSLSGPQPRNDITHFVLKDKTVTAGSSDGSLWKWNTTTGDLMLHYKVSDHYIRKVDVWDNLVAVGSSDHNTVKIVNTVCNTDTDKPVVAEFNTQNRVHSVAFSLDGSQCCSGTSAVIENTSPILVWDMNRETLVCSLGNDHLQGAGVYDIKYETPHTFLSGSYDAFLRLWDMRTQTCVGQWEDPFDYAVYCVQSDNNMTMFTGTARDGLSRLWDKRITNNPVGMYHPPNRRSTRSSPVYSLAHNSQRLFVALDLAIHMYNFSVG